MTALVPPAKITPTRQLVKSIDLLRRCNGDDAGTSGPTNRSRKGISELQSVEFADVRHCYLPIEGSRNPTRSARPAVSVRFSVRPIDISLLERGQEARV